MPVQDFLVPYFQRNIDLGLMRPHDPELSARAFVGTLVYAVFCDEIFLYRILL